MAFTFHPCTLKGTHIQLEPLSQAVSNELYDIAQDERIWTYSGSKAYGAEFQPWFTKALSMLEQKQEIPFAVRLLADNKIVGSTRYYFINQEHKRLAIGYTWYVPAVWGSYVNPEAKLLLLTHAFETLQMSRVEFLADARNEHSRAAIKKLGAKEEGILRKHMVLKDGFVRDTVIYSILEAEWPHSKANLQNRLAAFA